MSAHRYRFFALLVVLCGCTRVPIDSLAQPYEISGQTVLTDWPLSRLDASGDPAPPLKYEEHSLLPFIDSLSVRYLFASVATEPDQISAHFEIDWLAGNGGIVNGQRVFHNRMPSGVVIESVDLLMDVMVDGVQTAELALPIDLVSTRNQALRADSESAIIDNADVDLRSLFNDVDEEGARRIFDAGFSLANPRIVRIAFAIESLEYTAAIEDSDDRVGVDRNHQVEYIPDMDIWFTWRQGIRLWRLQDEDVSVVEKTPRGGIGRSGSADKSRSARNIDSKRPRSGNGSSDDEDEDDDEDRLLPAAIIGVAAVAGVAVAGGTIGYFGSAEKAPIGLMSGYVARDGGFLIQVAVNRQVFGKVDGPENLVASVTSFYNIFDGPLAPAVGLGARFTEDGTEGVRWKPSISIGVVGTVGPVVLLAGYDLTTPDFRFGTAVNFRYSKRQTKNEPVQ